MRKLFFLLIFSTTFGRFTALTSAEDDFDKGVKEAYLKDKHSDDYMIMDMRHRLKSKPNNPTYLFNLGYSYFQCELYDDALGPLEKVKTLEPRALDARVILGAVYFGLHRYQDAEREFKEVTVLKPDHVDGYGGLARVYQRMGRNDQYKEQLDIVKKIDPAAANKLVEQITGANGCEKECSPHLNSQYLDRATNLIALAKYLAATEEVNKAICCDPNNAVAYYNMGIALKQLGVYHKALAFYKRALSLDPLYVNAYINMGNIYLDIERESDAIRALKTAMTIDDNIPEIYATLGIAYKELGQMNHAKENLNRALELFRIQGRDKEIEVVSHLLNEIR